MVDVVVVFDYYLIVDFGFFIDFGCFKCFVINCGSGINFDIVFNYNIVKLMG